MINSMTAYARAEKTNEELTVSVEIRSYNSRHLDIALRVPHGYFALEEKVKCLIEDKIERGRIEVNLKIIDKSDEAYAFEINMAKAKAYYESLAQLKNQLNVDSEISIDLIVSSGGVIRPAEIDRDMEACWTVVKECMNESMADLVAMRRQEGDFIAEDTIRRFDIIEKSIGQIERGSADLLFHYQNRLKDRISILTK